MIIMSYMTKQIFKFLQKVWASYTQGLHKRSMSPTAQLVKMEMKCSYNAVKRAELTLQHLMVQTLQATTYNGVFIWKIPELEVQHEAKIGKMVSLYSAPFYTGRHGYKVCLRLQLHGCAGDNSRQKFPTNHVATCMHTIPIMQG